MKERTQLNYRKEPLMQSRKFRYAILTLSLAVFGYALGFSTVTFAQCEKREQSKPAAQQQAGEAHKGHDQPIPRYYKDPNEVKEVPKTMSPERFTNPEVRKAYEAAQNNPKLLLQMPCFCYCDQRKGHNSLLDCFVDEHGSGCDRCMEEAVEAVKLANENWSVEKIREKIISDYAKGH